MGKTETRQRARKHLDHLSDENVVVAERFLAWLETCEGDEATAELLRIPGFLEELEEAKKDIEAGRLTPVEDLKRKY
jgi:hypothetical protein